MKKCILCLFTSFFSIGLHAEPKVVYEDETKTDSLESYNRVFTRTESIRSANQVLRNLMTDDETKNKQLSKNITQEITQKQKSWLPITTPELSFAEIEDQDVFFPDVSRPFCVIGNDKNSMKWIDAHKDYLTKINAYCWLVEVGSRKDITKVYSHTKGLQVVPAQGTVLNKVFGIKHYPVLVTSRKIMQ